MLKECIFTIMRIRTMNRFSLFVHSLITLALTLGTAVNSYSQNDAGRIDVKIRKPEFAQSARDQNNNYVFILRSSSQYQLAFFRADQTENGNIAVAIPDDNRKDEIIGAGLNGDICKLYLYNLKHGKFSQVTVNRTNGQTSVLTLGQLSVSDKYLKSVFVESAFYILTVPQGKNELHVWKIEEDNLERRDYIINMPDFYRRLSTDNSYLNEETETHVGIDRINYDLENNVKSAQSTKKLYVVNHTIVMTFDDPDYTHMVTIDTDAKQSDYKKLQFSLEKSNASSKKQGNSFLYRDILFRSTINMDQLNISIVRLESMELLANYNAYPNQEIDFKNGPMYQEGNSDKVKVIEDNGVFFRRILNGFLSIAVNQRDSVFIVETGGYEIYNSGGGFGSPNGGGGPNISMSMGMGMGMGGYYGGYPYMGGMGGMGGYGWGNPGYYYGYPGYYPYNSYTTTIRTVYFHSLLSTETLNHQAGLVPISLRERISNFQTTMFQDKDPELVRIISFEDKIIIGYFIANTNQYRTYSFLK